MINTSNPTMVVMVLLPGGRWVSKTFLDEVRNRVAAVISTRKFGVEYKIQHLVDQAYWSSLPPSDRRIAGRCLAHLVSTRQLALAFVSCPRCTTKVYRRI